MAENSEETAKRETWGRPFQPGQSGNPGGRPKVIAEARDLARQHTALAIETLVHIMQHGDKDAARVTAARAILDRAWGKTVQPLGTEDRSSSASCQSQRDGLRVSLLAER